MGFTLTVVVLCQYFCVGSAVFVRLCFVLCCLSFEMSSANRASALAVSEQALRKHTQTRLDCEVLQ